MREEQRPEITGCPAVPPEELVKNKEYLYAPCPIKISNPLLRMPYLHELFQPGEHSGCFWVQRTPKKLNSRLEFSDSQENVGWGVHIVEGPNWMAFFVLLWIILVLSLVLSVTYAVLKKDVSSGFTMGGWVVAVFTAFNTLIIAVLSQR